MSLTPLGDELTALRERWALVDAVILKDGAVPVSSPRGRWPDEPARLIRAAHAVLALHQPGPYVILGRTCALHSPHRHFSITEPEAASVRACADCMATVQRSCTGCDGRPCPTVAAIAAELLGEGKPNGG